MKDPKPPAALSLWLVPCSSEASHWQQLIDSLAAKHNGPPFTAHVTTATISLAQLHAQHLMGDVNNWLEAVAGDFGPLTLSVSPPTTGDSFFRCVLCEVPTAPVAEIGQSFLALASNSLVLTGLQNIQAQASQAHQIETQATQSAHISLFYGAMTIDEKKAIAEEIAWPGSPLTLDTLILVGPGEGRADFSDPTAWEMLASARLTGEPATA